MSRSTAAGRSWPRRVYIRRPRSWSAGHGKLDPSFHHLLQGIKPPKAETYCATEAPKGELGFFIVSDGSARPYRLKIRSPSFVHMGAFDHMARGCLISDIITIFGTYDVVMGECDR
jgi:NADH-quinone oxidoreductase subunit C/D